MISIIVGVSIVIVAILKLILLWLSFLFYDLLFEVCLKAIQLHGIMLKLNPNHNITY